MRSSCLDTQTQLDVASFDEGYCLQYRVGYRVGYRVIHCLVYCCNILVLELWDQRQEKWLLLPLGVATIIPTDVRCRVSAAGSAAGSAAESAATDTINAAVKALLLCSALLLCALLLRALQRSTAVVSTAARSTVASTRCANSRQPPPQRHQTCVDRLIGVFWPRWSHEKGCEKHIHATFHSDIENMKISVALTPHWTWLVLQIETVFFKRAKSFQVFNPSITHL
jgi:hypothetical protein